MANNYFGFRHHRENKSVDLLIFLNFILGSSAAAVCVYVRNLPGYLPPVSALQLFTCLFPMTAALLLSSSLLGPALMPVCSLAGGAITAMFNAEILFDRTFSFSFILPLAVSVPAFFITAVSGIKNSLNLCTAFCAYSSKFKERWTAIFSSLTVTVAAAMLIIYLLTQLKI